MNKFQEALHKQKETLMDFHYRCNSEVPLQEIDRWNTLQELVDKQTLMKPILDGSIYGGTCDKVQYICPNCKQIMLRPVCITKHKPNYCYKCGQALDWSEND